VSPYVDVRQPAPWRRGEDELGDWPVSGGFDVVPVLRAPPKADSGQPAGECLGVDFLDPDLYVDEVLGGEAGNGGGADVLDQTGASKLEWAEQRGDRLELARPGIAVGHDLHGTNLVGEGHRSTVTTAPISKHRPRDVATKGGSYSGAYGTGFGLGSMPHARIARTPNSEVSGGRENRGIRDIHLMVGDHDRAVGFCRDVFGMEVGFRDGNNFVSSLAQFRAWLPTKSG
jgi:hypothetical protein